MGSDDSKNPGIDPGLRLLTRIADFVEPLTRFDRGHFVLEASQHRIIVTAARQVFRVKLDFEQSEAPGDLPQAAVPMASASAMAAEAEAQLAAAHAYMPVRLADWASRHGEDPSRRIVPADCFDPPSVLGYAEPCGSCSGRGKIGCKTCGGAGSIACPDCGGRGSRPCSACGESGQARCTRCYGHGYEIIHRLETVWDAKTNTGRTQNVPERQACGGCGGIGSVACPRCDGSKRETCSRCAGQCTITCGACKGAGAHPCQSCAGTGLRHVTRKLVCSVTDSLEVAPRTEESGVADVLMSLTTMSQLISYADSYRCTAEADATTLHRETLASIPVTSVIIAIGARRTTVHGFGPNQDVRDFANIAGLLLSDDLDALEATLPATRLAPPRATDAMNAALANSLASETNAAIAELPTAKHTSAALEAFQGLVAREHVARTSRILGMAIRRAYWATMARGPVAALALPLLQLPVELMLRRLDGPARLSGMLGVMLLAFGGAIAAHMLAMKIMQNRLAPGGEPRISRIVSHRGHLRIWLIAAAIFIVAATPAVAALTNLMIPPSQP